MKRVSENGVVRFDDTRDGDRRAAPGASDAFLGALYDVLVYLDSMTSFGPGLRAMVPPKPQDGKETDEEKEVRRRAVENRKAYVIGYAAPMLKMGIFAADLMPAAILYLQKYTEFPKAPAKLIEFALMVKDERDNEEIRNRLALPYEAEGPLVSEETRRRCRERFRQLEEALQGEAG